MLSSFTMPQDMQEFTGDGCTHGQPFLTGPPLAWIHTHTSPLPTPSQSAYVSLGFPVRDLSETRAAPRLT